MAYTPTEVVDDDGGSLFDDIMEDGNGYGEESYMYDPIQPSHVQEDDGYEDEYSYKGNDDDEDETTSDESDIDPVEETELSDNQIIEDILKTKGIADSSKIKFVNDEGEIEELDFYELSYEEQLNILSDKESEADHGLEEYEVQAVNFLRQNNVTFEEAIDYFKAEAVEQYKKELRGETLQIDSLSDEEIFVLDLQASYDDLTETEIVDILNHELENDTLFKRKTAKLRKEYREAEEKQLEDQDRLSKEAKDANVKKLHENVIEVASEIEDIGGIDLFDEDKEQVLRYITERDINGKTAIDKAIEDPKELFRISWFLSKGEEAFDILHSYYKNEIDTVRKKATAPAQQTQPNKQQGIRKNEVAIKTQPRNSRSAFDEFYSEDDITTDLYNSRRKR